MDNGKKSLNWVLLILAVVLIGGVSVFLFLRSRSTEEESPADEAAEQVEDRETEVVDDDSEPDTDEDTDDTDEDRDEPASMENFSTDTQTVGSSEDKDDSDYTLSGISEEVMGDYHRIVFNLTSDDEDELPLVEAKLISSGGYIQVVLDRVTQDNSGIGYQDARELDENGVLRIYHDVSSNQSEEVYNIGIAEDTEFYLYKGEGLSVVLEVAYPGSEETSQEEDEGVEEDTGEFSTSDQTIPDTNTSGTARIGTYTWANSAEALKFVWNTSASSGNPIPDTHAEYDESNDEIIVTFKGVEKDFIADGFENSLTGPVSTVTGQRSGTTSTYTFKLTKDTEYRIYKNLSPNQVVIEIKR